MKNLFREFERKSLKSFNAHNFYSFCLSHRAIQNDKCRIKNVIFIPILHIKMFIRSQWLTTMEIWYRSLENKFFGSQKVFSYFLELP